jgi:hypothetical protein
MIREEMRGKGVEVPETSSEAEEGDGAEKEEGYSSEEGDDGGSGSDNDDDDRDEVSSGHDGASLKVDAIN